MPHPFSPDDFPIDEEVEFTPTKVFYLRGVIHFKKTAKIIDLSGRLRQPFITTKSVIPGFRTLDY